MPIVRIYKMWIFCCLEGDNFIADLLQHKFFFIQNHGIDCVIRGCGLAQFVMKFEFFRVPCHLFFAAPQIEVDDRVEYLEVGELELDARLLVVLSVPEIDQTVQNSQFEVVLVFCIGVIA